MKRTLIVIAIFFAACATRPSRDFQSGDAEAVIHRASADFTRAVNAGNVDAIVSAYGDSAVLMPPNGRPFAEKRRSGNSGADFLRLGNSMARSLPMT